MKYEDCFEVASLAVRDLKRSGWKFERGTPRMAALEAVRCDTEDDVKSAITRVLSASGARV